MPSTHRAHAEWTPSRGAPYSPFGAHAAFTATGTAHSLAEGKAEGRAEGEARALLAVLEARGLAVSEPLRQRILSCSDLARLETRLARAATATSASEVLGE